jgi:hypothetical protein
MKIEPKGPVAARIRKRMFDLLKRFPGIPQDLLPGSLALTHGRCGKASCHCASGEGHASWSLTFMVDGKKRVERVPEEWVEDVKRRVVAGREFKDAVAEVFAANAELLGLWRRQAGPRSRRAKT